MQQAIVDSAALNARDPRVDSDIKRYMGSLAGRNPDRFCCPSLASIAMAAWTSPLVVKERLESFEKDGLVFPVVKEIGGERVCGWIVPKRKRKRLQTAAGFGGGDREFLKACGVAAEG